MQRTTSLLEAYSPVSTALRTLAAISGGKAMLIFSAAGMGKSYHIVRRRPGLASYPVPFAWLLASHAIF
jgi:hypothetical protein